MLSLLLVAKYSCPHYDILVPLLLQGNTLESKAHCMQYELSHSDLNIEAWLLARHSMAGTGRKTYYFSYITLS